MTAIERSFNFRVCQIIFTCDPVIFRGHAHITYYIYYSISIITYSLFKINDDAKIKQKSTVAIWDIYPNQYIMPGIQQNVDVMIKDVTLFHHWHYGQEITCVTKYPDNSHDIFYRWNWHKYCLTFAYIRLMNNRFRSSMLYQLKNGFTI